MERLEIQEWEQKTNRFKDGIRDTGVELRDGGKGGQKELEWDRKARGRELDRNPRIKAGTA